MGQQRLYYKIYRIILLYKIFITLFFQLSLSLQVQGQRIYYKIYQDQNMLHYITFTIIFVAAFGGMNFTIIYCIFLSLQLQVQDYTILCTLNVYFGRSEWSNNFSYNNLLYKSCPSNRSDRDISFIYNKNEK